MWLQTMRFDEVANDDARIARHFSFVFGTFFTTIEYLKILDFGIFTNVQLFDSFFADCQFV